MRISAWLAACLLMLLGYPGAAGAGLANDRPVARCGGFLEGIVVDAKGAIWALDVTGDRILQIDGKGGCVVRGRTGGMPNGAKIAPDGSLTIADQSGLIRFDTATGRVERLSFMHESVALTGLNDLAYDRAGGLYITVPGRSNAVHATGRVFYRAADGRVQLLAGGLAYPNGIAVAPDGETVAVAEFAAKRILSLPSVTGNRPLRMAHVLAHTQGGVGPDGIMFDAGGRLFSANLGDGTVQIFGADERLQQVLKLPPTAGAMPTNLAVDVHGVLVTEAQRGEIWRVAVPAAVAGSGASSDNDGTIDFSSIERTP